MTDVSSVCSLDSKDQHHGSRHVISLVQFLQGRVTCGGMCVNDTLYVHISAVINGFICVIRSSRVVGLLDDVMVGLLRVVRVCCVVRV